MTPCPTKTSSSIVTPSQMNVWLWILQRAPTTAPRWISTNVPDPRAVADAAAVEVRERVHDDAFAERDVVRAARYGASFAGASATVEVLLDRRDDVRELLLRRFPGRSAARGTGAASASATGNAPGS